MRVQGLRNVSSILAERAPIFFELWSRRTRLRLVLRHPELEEDRKEERPTRGPSPHSRVCNFHPPRMSNFHPALTASTSLAEDNANALSPMIPTQTGFEEAQERALAHFVAEGARVRVARREAKSFDLWLLDVSLASGVACSARQPRQRHSRGNPVPQSYGSSLIGVQEREGPGTAELPKGFISWPREGVVA